MGKQLPQISDAEFVVMKIVWANNPINTNQIFAEINKTKNWKIGTLYSLLNRLVKKGMLGSVRIGHGANEFTPLVNEEDYTATNNASFLGKFFGGDFSACVLSMAKGQDDESIDALMQKLKELRDKEE